MLSPGCSCGCFAGRLLSRQIFWQAKSLKVLQLQMSSCLLHLSNTFSITGITGITGISYQVYYTSSVWEGSEDLKTQGFWCCNLDRGSWTLDEEILCPGDLPQVLGETLLPMELEARFCWVSLNIWQVALDNRIYPIKSSCNTRSCCRKGFRKCLASLTCNSHQCLVRKDTKGTWMFLALVTKIKLTHLLAWLTNESW